jgi:hypothetical protein
MARAAILCTGTKLSLGRCDMEKFETFAFTIAFIGTGFVSLVLMPLM